MSTPLDFYTSQISIHNGQLQQIKKKLNFSSFLRLIVILLMLVCIYLGYPNSKIIMASIGIGIALFLFLISRHSKIAYEKRKLKELIAINEKEIRVANRNFEGLDPGTEFYDPTHAFSHDIDLFGDRSFFQFINRTSTKEGKNKLAYQLAENSIDTIGDKQEAIRNLSKMPEWRQEFSATATLGKVHIAIPEILQWISGYKAFVPKIAKILPGIFSIASVVMIGLLFLEVISFNIFLFWLFVGLTITASHLKKINKLYSDANNAKDTFEQYYRLVDSIEKTTFTASLLQKKKSILHSEREKTSLILKKFAKILDAFDQRNNMIYGILGNGLFLWDLLQCYRIEKWIAAHSQYIQPWFEVISFYDAFNSLGNFAFNHPTFIYPKLVNGNKIIEAKDLGHPMLVPNNRIDNSISIDKEAFFIITGANMAGKSTFLRTVALQIVMSNAGLPICASSCSYRPIRLISSMRTSDSLSDNASYFFSELTQLKKIVSALEKHEYFIILDEILKGTNSKDKAEGSRKFVEKLVKSKATGIIATHDLSLCSITSELPQVKNKYFDAQIINDELYFDYTFKDGICKNMNASFLLDKMGIV